MIEINLLYITLLHLNSKACTNNKVTPFDEESFPHPSNQDLKCLHNTKSSGILDHWGPTRDLTLSSFNIGPYLYTLLESGPESSDKDVNYSPSSHLS